MAHEYTVGVAPELSELENDALAWRAIRRDNLRIDNFVFKFALEQEKYLHSEEHRKQQLLKRIEEIEVNSEPEAEKPEPETETICTALFFEGGQDMNDELRRLLMEQMQLLHEQSRADAILPGELAELSNAMTSIAGVLLQLK